MKNQRLKVNKITAILKNIIFVDNLHLLEFEKEKQTIYVLILQMNLDLKVGDKVCLYIKPTKLYLSKKKCEYENVLEVNIKKIEKGNILVSVICEIEKEEIEVIMLNKNINFEKKAYLMFKASDISILEKSNV